MRELRIPIITGMVMILVLSLLVLVTRDRAVDNLLKVAFLDVGQGDAIFIESPSGVQVLIDGGRDKIVLTELRKQMGFFDRDIDMVVATHPDADHIGGLVDVLERYSISTILMTENVNDTPVATAFEEKVRGEGAHVVNARRGQVYDLGIGPYGSTTLTVLFPDHDPKGLESNLSSIVLRLVYGKSEYIFTGDSPQQIEEYLVSLGTSTLVSDVLKVGHHGSRTSSSEMFVRAVNPEYAIISAGKDNSYGHPHKEVTDILNAFNIQTKNTANQGSIFSFSNGVDVWFK